MSDDRTNTQWGVQLPNGTVQTCANQLRAEEIAADRTKALADAGSDQTAIVVTRTETIAYTDWRQEPS